METSIVTSSNVEDQNTVVLDQLLVDTENNISAENDETSEVIKPLDNNVPLDELESQLEKQKEALSKEIAEESNLVKDGEEVNENNISKADVPDKTEQQQNLNKHLVKIDKDYIATQPEEQREILESILGKKDYTLSDPQLLKNYVNSQMKIKEDLAEIERLKNEKKVPEFSKEETDEVSTLTHNLVESELKALYPDMPKLSDKGELNYWLIDKNRDDPFFSIDFREKRNSFENDFKKEAQNEVLLSKNWQSMAKSQTEKEISEFENFVKNKGLTFQDLGLNPTDESFIKSILFKDGKNNPDVIQMYKGRIPVVMNGRVTSLLKDRFTDKIIELKEIAARQSAFSKKQSLSSNPSMSNSSVAGKVTDVDKQNAEVRKFGEGESLETMETELQRQKEKLGLGTGLSIS